MSARRLLVVDTESSGLASHDIPVEVAWEDVETGECGSFIPPHDVAWVLAFGHPDALRINRYVERIADQPQDDGTLVHELHQRLTGQSAGGANPGFDAGMLGKLFTAHDLSVAPYHHRLPNIEDLTAGALGIPVTEIPPLSRCCELWGVTPGDHTALGDVRAAAECFRALERHRRVLATFTAASLAGVASPHHASRHGFTICGPVPPTTTATPDRVEN